MPSILRYQGSLKEKARQLRRNLTDSESALWSRVRGKQLMGVQFYRQKPIGNYIVDFYAPRARLVIEVDGSQHGSEGNSRKDQFRDAFLSDVGLKVLRFNSREVLKETDSVVEAIYRAIQKQMY